MAFYEGIDVHIFFEVIDIILDIIFIIELVSNFFIAYYDNNITMIDSYKKIFINYLFGWFFLDLISAIPFALIELNISIKQSNISKFVRFFKVPKLLKIFRFRKLMNSFKYIKKTIAEYNININRINPAIERLSTTLITVSIFLHILSCVWYMSGTWIKTENWILNKNYTSKSIFDKYLLSLYWVIQTVFTVGYGDVPAINVIEKAIAIICMFCGVFIYSFVAGSISSIFFSIDELQQVRNNNLECLSKISKKYKIDNKIYKEIKNLINKQNYIKDLLQELISDLPNKIKIEIEYSIYKKKLEKNKYFDNKSLNFIALIGNFLKQINFQKGDIIFNIGEPAEEIYFLFKGICAVININNESIMKFYKGDYFGEWDILFFNSKRKYKIISVTDTKLYALSKQDFNKIYFDYFINYKQIMLAKAVMRINKINNALSKSKINSQNKLASMASIILQNNKIIVKKKSRKLENINILLSKIISTYDLFYTIIDKHIKINYFNKEKIIKYLRNRNRHKKHIKKIDKATQTINVTDFTNNRKSSMNKSFQNFDSINIIKERSNSISSIKDLSLLNKKKYIVRTDYIL